LKWRNREFIITTIVRNNVLSAHCYILIYSNLGEQNRNFKSNALKYTCIKLILCLKTMLAMTVYIILLYTTSNGFQKEWMMYFIVVVLFWFYQFELKNNDLHIEANLLPTRKLCMCVSVCKNMLPDHYSINVGSQS